MRRRIVFLVLIFLPSFCGLSWADDCGLRGYDGTAIVKFDCTESSESQLRVTTPQGVTRGIILVNENSAGATPFRVRLNDDTIKALGALGKAISSCEELQKIGHSEYWATGENYPLDGIYYLTKNIDCSATIPDGNALKKPTHLPNAGSLWANGGLGFNPIRTFNGAFNGQNHVISDLYINRPSEEGVGLFGTMVASAGRLASVKNMGMESPNITGRLHTGGLAGEISYAEIVNAHVNNGVIQNAPGGSLGGLIGCMQNSWVLNSYARANVSNGTAYVGGLVGQNLSGSIHESYAMGSVSGTDYVGGLAGRSIFETSSISNSYFIGSVTVQGTLYFVGGLVGQGGYNVSNSYAVSPLIVDSTVRLVGGLIGSPGDDLCSYSYWNTDKYAANNNVGTGKPTSDMTNQTTFTNAGWNFETNKGDGSVWKKMSAIVPADTYYPCLAWQDDSTCPKTFTCGTDNVTFTYKGAEVTYGTVASAGACWMDRNLGASRVAQSSTDDQAYGDLFQWGRLDDGHQNRTSGTTTTLSTADIPGHSNFIPTNNVAPNDWRCPQNDNLWQGVNGINNPCPHGWRMPNNNDWYLELNSWDAQTRTGAFNSPLKLPLAGLRNCRIGLVGLLGMGGYYWSVSADGAGEYRLAFDGSNAILDRYGRCAGFSVRCIKD